jgi:hypothetical protein
LDGETPVQLLGRAPVEEILDIGRDYWIGLQITDYGADYRTN